MFVDGSLMVWDSGARRDQFHATRGLAVGMGLMLTVCVYPKALLAQTVAAASATSGLVSP